MNPRAGFDNRLGQMVASRAAARFVGRAHGVAQHAHQPEIQRSGDQGDRGGSSHLEKVSKSCARPVKSCAGCAKRIGLCGGFVRAGQAKSECEDGPFMTDVAIRQRELPI
jgi:hypothetical protein